MKITEPTVTIKMSRYEARLLRDQLRGLRTRISMIVGDEDREFLEDMLLDSKVDGLMDALEGLEDLRGP